MSNDLLQILLTIIVALPGIGALILQFTKNKPEIKKIESEIDKVENADTAETYAKAAEIAGKKNIELYERIDKIEKKVEYLSDACILKDKEIEELEKINREKDIRILELEKTIKEYEIRIKNLENEVSNLRNTKEDK